MLEAFHHQRELMVETVTLICLEEAVELVAQEAQERDLALEVAAVT